MPDLEKIDLMPYKDDAVQMFKYLNDLRNSEHNEDSSALINAAVDFSTKYNVDFCELGIKAMEGGISCWDVVIILREAVPSLRINKSTFIQLLSVFNKNMSGDLAAGIQYELVVKLSEMQPDFAKEVVKDLIILNEPFVPGYISAVYKSLGKNDIEGIHAEITASLSGYTAFENRGFGLIIALAELPYDSQKDETLIDATVTTLEKLINSYSSRLKSAVTFSLCSMITFKPEVKNAILILLKEDDPEIKYQVSRYLLLNKKEIKLDSWHESVLLILANTEVKYSGIIKNLDIILSDLIQSPETRELAKKVLYAWIMNTEYNETIKTKKLFNSTFNALLSLQDETKVLLTELFNDDNSRMHLFAGDIVEELSRGNCRITLSPEKIQQLPYADILYITRKVLGYVYNATALCSIFYSILESTSDENVLQIIASVFNTFIGVDFPGTTDKYLDERLSELDGENGIKPLVKSIADKIKMEQKRKESLPRLKEFEAPQRLLRQIHREDRKSMGKIMELVEKESVFLQFVTKTPIKYGKSWFNYHEGQYSPPHFLKEYRHSVELPSSEVYHPVTAALSRTGFRLAKRGEV